MKVHALLNVYNDHTFISACLESIKDHVDTIIVADGAYDLYYQNYLHYDAHVKPWSTDGTIEIIQAFKGLPTRKIIRCPDEQPWKNQLTKRTSLLDAVPAGDWFIIIDADEMLKGDMQEGLETIFESGCAAGNVPLYNIGLDAERLHPYWHPRIFLKMEGMHYYGTHWQLRDKHNRIIESVYPLKWTDKFVFVHLKYLKQPTRVLPHRDYMRLLGDQGWLEPKI